MTNKIMIIEDDDDILEILSGLFTEEGYEVRLCTDGDVFDTVKSYRPDLILCDIWLPKLKGTELCKLLKADPSTSKIPFIVISTSMNIARLAHDCGADSWIEKPFNIRELTGIVKSYLL